MLLSTYAVAEDDAEDNYNAQRHAVAENALSAAGLPTTFLRPSTFALNTLSWADSVCNEGRVSLPFPEVPFAPIHKLDIADVAAFALTHKELVGTAPVLTGPEFLTQAQQVERLLPVSANRYRYMNLPTSKYAPILWGFTLRRWQRVFLAPLSGSAVSLRT